MFDWITGVVAESGYIGIALLMLAENVFPPIPSELIMPLAGFAAAEGRLNIVLVLLSGLVGSLAGALAWYFVCRSLGLARVKSLAASHGHWVTLSPADVQDASDWFDKHGSVSVLAGRTIPAVRTLISVPAGLVRMGLAKFLLYSSIGISVWNCILVAAGYLLQDNYHAVSDYLGPVSTVIVFGLLAWYGYRVATWRPGTQAD